MLNFSGTAEASGGIAPTWRNFRDAVRLHTTDPTGLDRDVPGAFGYTGGASSLERLPAGASGAFSWKINQGISQCIVGMSATDATAAPSEQKIGLRFAASFAVAPYENGVQGADIVTGRVSADVWEIAVAADGSVAYKRNGATIRTLAAGTITTDLYVDVSVADFDLELTAPLLSGGWVV